jgi:hypothetical protein
MSNSQIIGLVLAVLFVYQLRVTKIVCFAEEYDDKQLILQCLMIWLIPFFGALTCHLVLRSSRIPSTPGNTDFVPQLHQDSGPGDVATY